MPAMNTTGITVTRWLGYFFKMWPFVTMKICSIALNSNYKKELQNCVKTGIAKVAMDSNRGPLAW